MTIGHFAICEEAIAAETPPIADSSGELTSFGGYGAQGTIQYRGERFWATAPPTRFRARESDHDDMLGVTDKDPEEKVWYEVDWTDVLNGASILSASYVLDTNLVLLAHSIDTNGEVNYLTKFFLGGATNLGTTYFARVSVVCSDGSRRKRTLKIRSREL